MGIYVHTHLWGLFEEGELPNHPQNIASFTRPNFLRQISCAKSFLTCKLGIFDKFVLANAFVKKIPNLHGHAKEHLAHGICQRKFDGVKRAYDNFCLEISEV